MSQPKIALFGDHGSPQVDAIRAVFDDRGVPVHVFDIQLGGNTRPQVLISPDKLVWNGVDFSAIEAVHVRCMAVNTPVAVPPVMNETNHAALRERFLREQEFQSVTRSFFAQLQARGKLVANTLTRAYVDHDTKAQLYQKLHDAGFCVPDTLMTNDARQAAAFFARVGEAVAKPSIGIGSTRRVSDYDKQRLDELDKSPVLFQELIEGDTIRVHIVGDKVVLALRIISGEGQVDSRTDPQGFVYFRMPDEEERKLVEATHFLGLHYAAWDILAAKDGRFAYLDCNPGPFILWIGENNSRAVFEQLANMLTTYAATRSLAAAYDAVIPCTASLD
ncbi:ATP-grasp domain-containing protein [Granulosicoccaceae sp. 1_MG-2023]|nr:ATP-grasp domain-containing protein [Granulosicoccaceae sp. 1_MG-2023]